MFSRQFPTLQIPDAIIIGIHETAGIYLIEDSILPPTLVILAGAKADREQKYNHDEALHDLNDTARDHAVPYILSLYSFVRLDGKKEHGLFLSLELGKNRDR